MYQLPHASGMYAQANAIARLRDTRDAVKAAHALRQAVENAWDAVCVLQSVQHSDMGGVIAEGLRTMYPLVLAEVARAGDLADLARGIARQAVTQAAEAETRANLVSDALGD